MIITRPINHNEYDLLIGHEFKCLLIYDLKGKLVMRQEPPNGGWSHYLLEAFDCYDCAPYGWDAYLGESNEDLWIGSSEV